MNRLTVPHQQNTPLVKLSHVKHLCKLVHLFNERRKRCRYAHVNQTLHVLHGLLVTQVQAELVLHLNTRFNTTR